jgi:uncharacterized membrane protein
MSGVAAIGYYFTRISLFERVMAGVSAGFLIGNFDYSDAIGLIIAGLLTVANWLRLRKS